MLDWNSLEPGRFERAVQMILRDVVGATSIDGAGGDLAQDLRWDSPDGLVIFEVKSFSKRLASSQRKQIRHSLTRAVGLHDPARWVLVTRVNPRAQELAWLQGLGEDFENVQLEWFGQDWLDGQIAGREDLISYLEGPDYKLLRRAKQLGWESAAVESGQDLAKRLADLNRLGRDISPYWHWDTHSSVNGTVMVLAAKRPESADADPITITPTFSFPPDDPEAAQVAARLHEVLRVGGDITVPGQLIESFVVEAQSEATRRLLGERDRQVDRLRIMSIPDATGLPMTLTLDREAEATARPGLQLTITSRLTGAAGLTLLGADPSGALDVRLVLPDKDGGRGSLHLTLAATAGRLPHEILPTLQWLAGHQADSTLILRAGPLRLASFEPGGSWPIDLGPLVALTRALVLLQEHVGRLFRVPEAFPSGEELRTLLDVARALSGEQVRQRYDGIDATVRAGMLEPFLADVPEVAGALYVSHDVGLNLDDEQVVVGGLATWVPQVRLANRRELAAVSLDVTDHTARFEAVNDAGVFLIRSVPDPGDQFKAVAGTR